jgi:hypothetical protein
LEKYEAFSAIRLRMKWRSSHLQVVQASSKKALTLNL